MMRRIVFVFFKVFYAQGQLTDKTGILYSNFLEFSFPIRKSNEFIPLRTEAKVLEFLFQISIRIIANISQTSF